MRVESYLVTVECRVGEGRQNDATHGGHHKAARLKEPVSGRDVALDHAFVHKQAADGLTNDYIDLLRQSYLYTYM